MKNKILLLFVLFFTDSIMVTELFSQRYQFDMDYPEPVEEDFYDEGKEHYDWGKEQIVESESNVERSFLNRLGYYFVMTVCLLFGIAVIYCQFTG